MTTKRILLIGMLDSIHVGRWISQFEDTDISFVLLPAKKFRNIHPLIKQQISRNSKLKVRLYSTWIPHFLFGYFDFALKVLPGKIKLNVRAHGLRTIIKNLEFDYIHALEIQGAGYLLSEALGGQDKPTASTIITNWGSDIYYFKDFPEHRAKIIAVLKLADFYSAECRRDYKLARDLGFTGKELPCIPNAGGFEISEKIGLKASERTQIIVKCYGGQFGRGQLIIQALHNILVEFPQFRVLLFSVTEDLLGALSELEKRFSDQVQYFSQSKPIPHPELLLEFANSRVYVGASISDGISTSFLEALVSGAYPIQTNTSCADEWVLKGAVASLPNLESIDIESAIKLALSNNILVDAAQQDNFTVAKEYLQKQKVLEEAVTFYSNS